MNNYSEKNIKTLSPLEAMREKHGMYLGSTGTDAITHISKEILSNSIDEFLAGYGDKIIVEVQENSIKIQDFGRGIPHGKLEEIFTIPHTSGKFKGTGGYEVSGGLNGIGTKLATANGKIEVVSTIKGKSMLGIYEYGKDYITKEAGKAKVDGTTITWTPHKEPFGTDKVKADEVKELCREMAFICPHLEIEYKHNKEKETFYSEDLSDFIKYLTADDKLLSPIMTFEEESGNVKLEGAIAWSDGYEGERTYVNLIPTRDGGNHVSAIKTALTREWNKHFDTSFSGLDIRQGFQLVLSIKTTEEPEFSGQAKDKLNMPSITTPVSQAFTKELRRLMKSNAAFFKEYNKALVKQSKREEVSKLMNSITSEAKKIESDPFSNISDKYKGCSNDRGVELFIAEGDSAMTPISLVKSPINQAAYAIRGKLYNVFDKDLEDALKNQEIKELIRILGSEKQAMRKFDKIVIASDSDEDGDQIMLLILGFLSTFYPELIRQGKVYRLVTPRYLGVKGTKTVESYTEDLEWVDKYEKLGYNVTYLKGLGQISFQIMERYINSQHRKLMPIKVDNWDEFYDNLEIALSQDKDLVQVRKEMLVE